MCCILPAGCSSDFVLPHGPKVIPLQPRVWHLWSTGTSRINWAKQTRQTVSLQLSTLFKGPVWWMLCQPRTRSSLEQDVLFDEKSTGTSKPSWMSRLIKIKRPPFRWSVNLIVASPLTPLISHLLCHRVNCWFCYHALYFSTPVFSLTSLDCVPGWNRRALKMSRDSRRDGRSCDGYRATECEATASGIAWSPVRPRRIPPNIVDWGN